MARRSFENLYNEICVAVDRRVSRYALWLLIWESGADPDELSREQAQDFIENQLSVLLREEGLRLEGRPRQRLARRIKRFDPRYPTAEEWLAR